MIDSSAGFERPQRVTATAALTIDALRNGNATMATDQFTTVAIRRGIRCPIIYGLVDAGEPDEIRYVGQTSRDVADRVRRHLNEARRGRTTYKANWIRAVLSLGRNILCVVIEEVGPEHCVNTREEHYIAQFRSCGFRLTNATDGGEGTIGYTHSDDAKRKMSLAAKNKTEETICRMSKAQQGKHRTMESRDRQRQSLLARHAKHTPESRRKMSDALIGHKKSAEWIQHLSEAHRGNRPGVEEMRWRREWYKSPERSKRISEACKAGWARKCKEERRKSADHRRKIGEGQARYAARKRETAMALRAGA